MYKMEWYWGCYLFNFGLFCAELVSLPQYRSTIDSCAQTIWYNILVMAIIRFLTIPFQKRIIVLYSEDDAYDIPHTLNYFTPIIQSCIWAWTLVCFYWVLTEKTCLNWLNNNAKSLWLIIQIETGYYFTLLIINLSYAIYIKHWRSNSERIRLLDSPVEGQVNHP